MFQQHTDPKYTSELAVEWIKQANISCKNTNPKTKNVNFFIIIKVVCCTGWGMKISHILNERKTDVIIKSDYIFEKYT